MNPTPSNSAKRAASGAEAPVTRSCRPPGAADLVCDQACSDPDAIAVAEPFGGTELTYAQLWERAGWLAAELAAAGITAGDVVAVNLPRSAELVTAFLGIVRAGAAYLPLDAHAPAGRIADILTESRARVVVCRPDAGSRGADDAVQRLAVPRAQPAALASYPRRGG